MVYKLHTLKRLYHLLPVVILLLMFAVFRLTESICGRPGISPNCDYNSYNMEYQVGETVTYYCRTNPCYAPNSMRRHCLENGSWSGTIPFCHKRATIDNIEQMLLISGTLIHNANLTMDRKNSTCLSTYIESNTHWEAVFKKSYRVIAVKILFPDRITEISTRVEILEDNRTVSNCENHPRITDIRRNSQLFICPHGVIGNTIRIIPVRTQTSSETEHFEICEVYVFIQWNQACLRPDLPYMATGVKIINPPKFVYECKDDYELVGDNTVYCQEDGTWTQTSFKCQRRTDCGKLPEVANGVIISNSTTINSTAWLKCNEGFRPLSDHLTYCLPTGMWTSALPCGITGD